MKRFASDDRGIAMVTALLATVVVMSLAAIGFTLSTHNIGQSTNDRRSTQAIHAAEAGLDTFLRYLAGADNVATSSPNGCNPTTGTMATSPAATFSVTVQYYIDTTSLTPSSPACPAVAPGGAIVTSKGSSGGKIRTMQAFVKLNYIPGKGALSPHALYSEGNVSFSSQSSVSSNPSGANNADVYSNGVVDLHGNNPVQGSVTAKLGVIVSGGASVSSFVRSSQGYVQNSGTVFGNAYYCTTVSQNGTVKGSVVHECPTATGQEDDPNFKAFPAFTYNAAEWAAKGYLNSAVNYTCTSAQTFLTGLGAAAAGKYVVRVNSASPCDLTLPTITMKGDLAIINNGNLKGSGSTGFAQSGATATSPFHLLLMSNVAYQKATPTGLICANGDGITLAAGVAFPTNVDVLFYTPCEVRFTGNAQASVQGQIIAGTVTFTSQGSNITYKPVVVPGVPAKGWAEELLYRREVI